MDTSLNHCSGEDIIISLLASAVAVLSAAETFFCLHFFFLLPPLSSLDLFLLCRGASKFSPSQFFFPTFFRGPEMAYLDFPGTFYWQNQGINLSLGQKTSDKLAPELKRSRVGGGMEKEESSEKVRSNFTVTCFPKLFLFFETANRVERGEHPCPFSK